MRSATSCSILIILIHSLITCGAFLTVVSVPSRPLADVKSASTLLARQKLDNETASSSCWDSLFTLQSCTGEIILFFLSGETYLGKPCCEAMRIIEHDCWPSMLTSLGYSEEEGSVLEGYCNGVRDGTITPINHKYPPPPIHILPDHLTLSAVPAPS